LAILAEVRKQLGVPVLTDVHTEQDIPAAAKVVDVLQTPAFLCRQTDFIHAAAAAGKPVNIKKGQFLSPWEMKNVVDKAKEASGADNIMVCERGASFGYNNLVSDMRSLMVMRETGCPVVFDATHSVQLPGAQGTASGGQREFVPVLARAAVASGIAGIFMETHPNPAKALRTGPTLAAATYAGVAGDAQRDRRTGQTEGFRGRQGQPLAVRPQDDKRGQGRGKGMSTIVDVARDSRFPQSDRRSGCTLNRVSWAVRRCLWRFHWQQEAIELRDGDAQRYNGKGWCALWRTSTPRSAIIGLDGGAAAYRPDPDRAGRDGEQIAAGANAILAVSVAVAKAAAEESGLPCIAIWELAGAWLPVPMMNVINGGAHAANNPRSAGVHDHSGGRRASARRCAGAQIFHALKKLIDAKGYAHHGGRRRRIRPEPGQQRGALQLIMEAIDKAAMHRGLRSPSGWIAPVRSSSTKASMLVRRTAL
jgi:3-deoxy-8-phosphooctulonate synthase